VKKRKYWLRPAKKREAAPEEADAQAEDAVPSPVKVAAVGRGARWRGVVLDLTVVVGNLFLLAPLARVLRAGGQGFLAGEADARNGVSPTVGWLFLAVFAAHVVGAYLKRLPRQARLAARSGGEELAGPGARLSGISERTRRRRLSQLMPRRTWSPNKLLVGVVCALLLGHFFIFMSLLFTGWQSTALESWSPLFGHRLANSAFVEFLVRFVLIVGIMPLPTLLVALSLGGDAATADVALPPPLWRTHWLTELLADLLLYFSIVVITLILNVLVAPRFAAGQGLADSSLGDVLASLVPLALAFSILYLPPRLIYLAEDYNKPLAWLTILLALLSLAYRTFFPAQGFAW
jgi:hypothetical protein